MTANIDPEVRTASVDDVGALTTDTETKNLLFKRLRGISDGRRGELRVALLEAQPVGHIYLWEEPAEEKNLRRSLPGVPLVMNLWVDPRFRRNRIGWALMQDGECRLYLRGNRRVALGIDVNNEVARLFYQKLHYSLWDPNIETYREHLPPIGHRYTTPDSCEVFVKHLTKPTPTADDVQAEPRFSYGRTSRADSQTLQLQLQR